MSWIMAKINKLKKSKKKNECIVLVWDSCGDGDPSDYENWTYINHDEECEEVYCLNAGGDKSTIDTYDDDYVKDIVIAPKNFKAAIKKVSQDKQPLNGKRHVGIELEFISKLSRIEVGMLMSKAGLSDNVCVKDDGSLDPDDDYVHAHEITILATEDSYKGVVKKICKLLRRNSKVNQTCGMHVHLDMRTRNLDMAAAALFEAQPILYAMNPNSRRTGTYSAPLLRFKSYMDDRNAERYTGINQTSYSKHKTIEVRMHSGTLQADKIINWVSLLLKIIDNAPIRNSLRDIPLINDLKAFKARFKLRGKVSNHIDTRIKSFINDHRNTEPELKVTGIELEVNTGIPTQGELIELEDELSA